MLCAISKSRNLCLSVTMNWQFLILIFFFQDLYRELFSVFHERIIHPAGSDTNVVNIDNNPSIVSFQFLLYLPI